MSSVAEQLAIRQVPPLAWKCNGGINPLIRSSDQLRQVTGAEWREACRWAAIHLHTYHLGGLPERAAAIMEKGGDWSSLPENELEQIARRFLAQRLEPRWMKYPPIAMGKTGQTLHTIAQVVAVHGGTDSRAKCHDLADLLKSIELVGSYNEFRADNAVKEFRKFNLARYYNPNNPNNGGDLFEYWIGWEGSLAIYIGCSFYCGCKALSNDYREEFDVTPDEFRHWSEQLGRKLLADENSINEDRKEYLTWRLWWD